MRSAAYDRLRLRKIAALVKGRDVLDIGYAQEPNPFFEGCRRVGYDLNLPRNGGVRYDEEIQGDVRQIADRLRGRRFDTIVCGELVEHLENPYQFLRDIHDLLSTDGRLILTTPNPLGWPVFLCEIFRLRRFFYTTEHLYYFLPRWVVRLAELSGYEMERIVPVGIWLPGAAIPFAPIALSYHVVYVAHKKEKAFAAAA